MREIHEIREIEEIGDNASKKTKAQLAKEFEKQALLEKTFGKDYKPKAHSHDEEFEKRALLEKTFGKNYKR